MPKPWSLLGIHPYMGGFHTDDSSFRKFLTPVDSGKRIGISWQILLKGQCTELLNVEGIIPSKPEHIYLNAMQIFLGVHVHLMSEII